MKKISLFFAFTVCISVSAFAQTASLHAFPLSDVRLLNSPFKDAQQTDLKYMMSLDADRLLAPYLEEAGIPPKAPHYGNWEGTGLNGHIGGHYISALSDMYAATGNKEVQKRLEYMLMWIDSCQRRNGDGYVGGIPGGRQMWQDIAAGKIDAASFSLNGKWVPLYNIHKLYAGLADAYLVAGNNKAKDILIKLCDWMLKLTSGLTDAQMQRMLRSEHGGLNEVFADVASVTGDMKYLELARRFSHQRILAPLLQQQDSLNGMHANTQIPKVIGFMRIAEVAQDKAWADAAGFFWNTVVQHRTVSIGGNSVREHFHPANNFSSMIESVEGPETCNSYNMLKLTRHLFLAEPDAKYMDYYERTLYNHILSSQHPDGGFVYFTPMRPNHYRVYSRPQESFWCCVGSGLENHGKYGELIYAHGEKDIFVNLFIPSVLNWKERGIKLTQETAFPFSSSVKLKMELKQPQTFALHFRYPSWVRAGEMKVSVNNKPVNITGKPSTYVSINRNWKQGDVVSVSLPMHTVVEYLPDSSSWASMIYGPVVLAAATDTTGIIGLFADDSRMGHIAAGRLLPIDQAPLIVSRTRNFASAVKPIKGKQMTFEAPSVIFPDKYDHLKLVPFFQVHDSRYMIYWSVSTPEELEKKRQALRETEASRLALESITLDQVAPGEQQPESDHNFKAAQTESGVFRDRHWRHAAGWFSYDLKNSKEARKLRVTYYGMDSNRAFDIYMNDKLVATVRLDGSAGDKFFDVDYEVPAEVIGSDKLTVRFVAKPGSVAGGVYYVRLIK